MQRFGYINWNSDWKYKTSKNFLFEPIIFLVEITRILIDDIIRIFWFIYFQPEISHTTV